MADVLQSHSPCSVPVGFHLSPLHPRLVYLPLLLRCPVQHAVAQQSSLLRARDVEDWQLSVDRGVNCALLAWFLAGHQWFWWCIFIPCLPAFVRVILITIIIPASLSTTRTGAVATTCAACGFLAHCGSICQLQTLAVRGVFVPVDFGHWDLLSVLLLEVGDEFSHLVGTPTSFCKSFLQSSRQAMVNEKGGKGFCSSDVGWTRWQGEMNPLLHALRCLCSLHRLWVPFIWALIRRVLQHHLPVCSSPWRRVLPRVGLSSPHC